MRFDPASLLQRLLANSAVSLLIAAAGAAGAGFLCVLLGTYVLSDYSIALFCGVPIVMGFIAPLFHGIAARRSFLELFAAGVLAQFAHFFGMIGFGVEGLGCVIMAAPLWLTLAVVGAIVAYPVHQAQWKHYSSTRGFPVIGLLMLAVLPLWMGAERTVRPAPAVWSVVTAIDIDAPPAAVWKQVIAFPPLPPPTESIFSLGVAYPLHATITGHGPGAMRRCVFSTGAFVEPITRWDENHLLAFDVVESLPSMQELSPYAHIHPPHLEGFLVSRHGQFELIDLGDGRTRLIGTTWYQNDMAPSAYWRLWSDEIIHTIHLRVLRHVKNIAEAENQLTPRDSRASPAARAGL